MQPSLYKSNSYYEGINLGHSTDIRTIQSTAIYVLQGIILTYVG